MSKTQISLGQLPLNDIDAYFQIVKGYTTKFDNSIDTKNVGGVISNKIAIAATDDEGNLIEGRTTINNSLHLGGKLPEEYLLKNDSDQLLADTYKVSTSVSSELKAIRDELYQMKAELSKAGLIKQGYVYNGFYDAFRNNDIKYDNSVITTIDSIGSDKYTINVVNASNIEKGQYVMFNTSEGVQISEVADKNENNILTLNSKIVGNLIENNNIYKTYGTYENGSFVFGEKSNIISSNEEYKVIVKDGEQRKEIKLLNDKIQGFASECKDMYSLDGYLNKIQLSVGCIGNPGNLRIILYKIKNKENREFEEIATSDAISNNDVTSSLNNINFVFNEPIRIYRQFDYLIFIKAEGVDYDNKWRIGGYNDPCDDGCLCCSGDTYDYINDEFENTTSNDDIYIAFYMSESINNEIKYSQRGIYTCHEEIPDGFTRIRVELRINREGIFTVQNNGSLVCKKGETIQLNAINMYEGHTLFGTGQDIIVGDYPSKVGNIINSNTKFSLDQDTYTPINAEVYRNGYKVIATVKNKIIDLNNSVPVYYKGTKVVELPLVCIMKGKEPGVESSSDRLIFEAEIGFNEENDILDLYDTFEIQIYWSNDSSIINTSDLAGIIYDLSVSTDKAYNKSNKTI